MNIQKTFPYILIIGSLMGLLASFALMIDTISLINNPNAVVPCDINPLISCTDIASKWQSNILGFPNPLLGIISFSMLIAIGIMLVSGGRSRKPLWLLVNLGITLAMIFVAWFFEQSVYVIGALCIYCMTVWAVTWPLFLYTTIWNFREEHFGNIARPFLGFLSRNHIVVLSTGYILAVFLILLHFKDFFFS